MHRYHHWLGDEIHRGRTAPLRVEIVSDCLVLTEQGNHSAKRHAHKPLWAWLEAYVRLNYLFRFHFLAREKHVLNRKADRVSKLCRKLILDINE